MASPGEKWWSGSQANAAATRALVNEPLSRSPRHGHALSRCVVVGRTCVGCKSLIVTNGAICKLCGVYAHRDCRKVPKCLATDAGPTNGGLSMAAFKYLSLQRAGESRMGRAILSTVEKRRGFDAFTDPTPLRAYASRAVVSSAEMAKMQAMASGGGHVPTSEERPRRRSSERGSLGQLGLWAGATAAGTFAGGVVGGAMAGPAGALLGAKIAQTGTNVGALVLGAAVGYRKRYLLSETTTSDESSAFERRGLAEKAAHRATFGRAGRGDDEPWAAAAASAVARSFLDGLAVEFQDADHPDLAARLHDDGAPLDQRIAYFVTTVLEQDHCPARVHQALQAAYDDATGDAADKAVSWSRRLCVEVVAYFPALARSPRALDAAERCVDRVAFGTAYDDLFPRFIDPAQDDALSKACDDTDQHFENTKHRHRFNTARDALSNLATTKSPLDKLHRITFAVRELAASAKKEDDDDEVSADILLPLAVDCVRAARVPHLHAHLAFVEALCHHRDFLGSQGYALTTLRCAVAVLCRNLDDDRRRQ